MTIRKQMIGYILIILFLLFIFPSLYDSHIGHPQWGPINHSPAAATQATITKAAGGAGTRHYVTSILACFTGTAVSAPLRIVLRDGASGVGPIVWSARIGIVSANGGDCIPMTTHFRMSINTAVTLEFIAAGAVGTNEEVTLAGFTEG